MFNVLGEHTEPVVNWILIRSLYDVWRKPIVAGDVRLFFGLRSSWIVLIGCACWDHLRVHTLYTFSRFFFSNF